MCLGMAKMIYDNLAEKLRHRSLQRVEIYRVN